MGDLTILDRLDRQAAERGPHPALLDPRSDAYDAWDTRSWSDYRRDVRRMARAFISLGHRPGDAVAIIGPNCSAWVIADLAAIAAGGTPAGIYATSTPEQAEYIIADAGASIAVACDAVQAEKVLSRRAHLPKLRAVVLFPKADKPEGAGELVLSWEEALAKAEGTAEARLDEIRSGLRPDGVATLIYTSGTTGPPKGVMLSHQNLTWTAQAANDMIEAHAGDRGLSYLPLAHIAEQMMTIHGPLTIGATIHFVPVLEHLPVALAAVCPHFMFGVPRVWEKIQAKVEAAAAGAPPLRRRLFAAAKAVGYRVTSARFEGRAPGAVDAMLFQLFDRLVYGKLRARLGLDHARILVTGAAALSPATRDWFLALGTPLSDVYGQSEDSGPTSLNLAGSGKIGSVGRPIPGVEVRIAEDGEILVRGPNVFLGYLNKPDATAETLRDGWLHSGDVGELDPQGFLRITDRKKDLIITAGGKNIAPQNIERELRELALVSQAVVIGEQQKYLTALVTLVPEETQALLAAKGIHEPDPELRARHPEVRGELARLIDAVVNPNLARYETIKRFEILPRELSETSGELTPTLKIKRKVVTERYAQQIAQMYVE